eukprot:NODE_221_length_12388_cov_2.350883.p1 type:complete len:658 gc:universal NODE_221_length_12388_cov_2.350883:4020-2047(-)
MSAPKPKTTTVPKGQQPPSPTKSNSSASPSTSPSKPKTTPKNTGQTPIKETTSQVHAPIEKPEVVMSDPLFKLELNYVFGYHAKERRNNLFYLPTALNATDNDLVIYTAGSLGIVHQKSSNTQCILQGHDDDVLGLAVHTSSRLVALGQVGRDAYINIYKISDTKFNKLPEAQLLKTCKVPRGSNGINALQFNCTGDLLYGVTRGDPNNEVLVYDWNNEKLLTSTRISNKVLDLVAHPTKKTECTLVGVKYIGFSTFVSGKLEIKRGEFGNNDLIQALPTAAYLNDDTVWTGTANGHIYVWKAGKLANKTNNPVINGNILALKKHMNSIICGGKDAKLAVLDADLKVLSECQLKEGDEAELPNICSIDTSGNEKFKILVGMRNCNISEWDTELNKFVSPAKPTKLVNAHDSSKDAELWGLDVKGNFAATCGDDGCVRIWNISDRKCIVKIKVGAARAICWHPKLQKIAVGLRSGTVHVFEGDEKGMNWTQMNKFTVSNRDVTCIRYGPNGKYLVTGAADGKIDVYDASNNHTRLGEMSGHTSRILSVDFNVEGTFLISNSTDKEVLYWDCEGLKQLTHADTIKQLKYNSYTCMFSWSTMGIWQQHADKSKGVHDASDINCVAVHPEKKILVDGTDNSTVQIWNWPRPRSKTAPRTLF